MNKLIAIALAFAGCGSVAPIPRVDATLQYAVAEFAADCDYFSVQCPFEFASVITAPLNTKPGLCRNFENGTWIVIVDDSLGEQGQLLAMYHELGHCIFGLEHAGDKSIMSPAIFPIETEQDWQRLKADFFASIIATKDYQL